MESVGAYEKGLGLQAEGLKVKEIVLGLWIWEQGRRGKRLKGVGMYLKGFRRRLERLKGEKGLHVRVFVRVCNPGDVFGVSHITEIKLNIIDIYVNVKPILSGDIARSYDTRHGQKIEVNYFTR